MIAQNDSKLNQQINLYGCRFRCLQAIAEERMGQSLTHAQILEGYEQAIKNQNIMSHNCTCGPQEHHIINHAFSMLGSRLNAAQIGSMQGKKLIFWDGRIRGFDSIIERWTTKTGYHFTIVFSDGNSWNPWDNNISKLKVTQKTEGLLYRIAE